MHVVRQKTPPAIGLLYYALSSYLERQDGRGLLRPRDVGQGHVREPAALWASRAALLAVVREADGAVGGRVQRGAAQRRPETPAPGLVGVELNRVG